MGLKVTEYGQRESKTQGKLPGPGCGEAALAEGVRALPVRW